MEKFIDDRYNHLIARKNELVKVLNIENAELKNSLNDNENIEYADVASHEQERLIMDTLSAENIKALEKIDAALARIQNGTYGVCSKCGKMIGHDRLEAIAEAVFCISCQSASERPH